MTETATAAALVAWGAAPAEATAGVVLFSVYTHLMEVPLGALGWVAWTLSPKRQPVDVIEAEDPSQPGDGPGEAAPGPRRRHPG